jgi:methylated-DNA-protein-cysteine methyltransferase related protein
LDFDAYAEAVLGVVARIPRGRVMSYGDIAEYVGSGSGRTVGRVMSLYAHGDVPWQRVVRASGQPAVVAVDAALSMLRAEGTPMRGDRVDMRKARWDGT